LEAYKIIQNTIYNQEDEVGTGLIVDNIDKLPMSEIEKNNNVELDKLAEGGQDILQMVFNDLKKGEIDRQEYFNILNGIKKFDEDVEKGNPEIDISTELIEYLENNGRQVASDVADIAGKTTGVAMSAISMYKAYGLHKQGFEITTYTTKGGRVRFRVHNPELIGISKPTKRDTKIYDREYVRDQIKRKNDDNVRIADRENVRAGAISELKSRAGWVGVAIDTGLNVKDNIMDGESTSRIIGDAGVDARIGAVSLAAGGIAASAVVGTLGAPVIVGAAIAIGAGYLVAKVTDIKIGDKNITTYEGWCSRCN